MTLQTLPATIEFERQGDVVVLRLNDAAVAAIVDGKLDLAGLLRDVAHAGVL